MISDYNCGLREELNAYIYVDESSDDDSTYFIQFFNAK